MTIDWENTPEQRDAAAAFFAANISQDAAYISHGEVQGGLSLDGKTWAADIATRFLNDLREPDPTLNVAVMRNEAGEIVAAALVRWEQTPRVTFGVIEDLAVPSTRRSGGLGAQMMEWIEAEAIKRKCRWLFLESGKNNVRAHHFFERHGFEEFSHVFIKAVQGV